MVKTAEKANRAKSDFLTNISHEIRTPLNVIIGITEHYMLEKDSLPPEIGEGFEKIYSAGDMLLSIINDILDLSKVEAGKLELAPGMYELVSLINDITQMNVARVENKAMEFKLSVDEKLPLRLIGDVLRIKQIINNLLSNAFKYTNAGEVSLSFSGEGAATDKTVTLVLRVRDTGQGMTAEQVDILLDENIRFNPESNVKFAGVGLGIGRTRELIRMMRGEMSVESVPGKGSCFTVKLPQRNAGGGELGAKIVDHLQKFRFAELRNKRKPSIQRENMSYGKVLVVDDMPSNLDVMKLLLKSYQIKVDTAGNGLEAIEIIKAGNLYDIVLMDHMMPKMDGVEATRKIREMGYTQPIVALTANAVIGQSETFIENGFDAFMSKPVDVRQLNFMLKEFVKNRHSPEEIEAANRKSKDSPPVQEGAGEAAAWLTAYPELAGTFLRDATESIGI
jgi:CheY-like chemotaxis protein